MFTDQRSYDMAGSLADGFFGWPSNDFGDFILASTNGKIIKNSEQTMEKAFKTCVKTGSSLFVCNKLNNSFYSQLVIVVSAIT